MDQHGVREIVLAVLDETFERHHGIFLDAGTSLFATLAAIDHGRASVPVGGRCATLAAQVAHVAFYLEVVERDLRGEEVGPVDWGAVWRTVGGVSAAEWDRLRADLEAAYRRLIEQLQTSEDWAPEPHLEVALAAAVHTAYHLGEIRQALCSLE
jgi:hypothetical protein